MSDTCLQILPSGPKLGDYCTGTVEELPSRPKLGDYCTGTVEELSVSPDGAFIPSPSLTRKPDSAKEVLLIVVDVETSSVLSCETVGDGTFGAVLHGLVKRRPDLIESAEGHLMNPGYICYRVLGGKDFIDGICLAMNLMSGEDIEALKDLLSTHRNVQLNFYGSF